MRILFLAFLICVALAHEVTTGVPPMNDLFSCDIARSGKTDFWKVDKKYWATIISDYPIVRNATTKITIRLVTGNSIILGVG